MEHYTPSHPLPSEIQAMERDETVCQFCGVSYLIHNEIKALELKLEKAEAELKRLTGLKEREPRLLKDLSDSQREISIVRDQLKERDSLVAKMQLKNEELENALLLITKQKDALDLDLKDAGLRVQELEISNDRTRRTCQQVTTQLRVEKTGLTEIKEQVLQSRALFTEVVDDGINQLSNFQKSFTHRISTDAAKYSRLEASVRDLEETNAGLSSQLQTANTKLKDFDQLDLKLKEMEADEVKASRRAEGLIVEVQHLQSIRGDLQGQLERAKQALLGKEEEVTTARQQLSAVRRDSEDRIVALSNDLDQIRADNVRLKGEKGKLLMEIKEANDYHNERRESVARNEEENRALGLKLERVLADLEALKLEREQMITAHHNRIEDLRESFRQKMHEAEKWPHKLEAALRSEKAKHEEELLKIEQGMKESFISEMQIERQKHQEMLLKMQDDHQSTVNQLNKQLKSASSNQSELESMKQQLKIVRADAQGNDARQRSEIQSLKKIISDLDSRLGSLDTGGHETALKLQASLSDKQKELDDCQTQIKKGDEENVQLKEQLRVLQDTVSRECEERMELIDALGDAREQLLLLKKPPGGYTGSSRNASPKLPSALQSPAHTSDELTPTSSSDDQASHKLIGVRENICGPRELPKSDSTSIKNLTLKTNTSAGKPLSSLKSLDDVQKKRLAAVLSRGK